MTDNEAFLDERRRARRFFNRMSPLHPIVERHLFPQYLDVLDRLALPPELGVLDLATGTGLLAGVFADRGHAVTRGWTLPKGSYNVPVDGFPGSIFATSISGVLFEDRSTGAILGSLT